jgi:uncharacterized membrane protein
MADAGLGGSIEQARSAALLLFGALIGCVAFAILREAARPPALALLGIVVLGPLLLPLPGIYRRRRRAYAGATLCLTPTFVYALTEIVANPALRALMAAMLVLNLAAMVALVAYLRFTRG